MKPLPWSYHIRLASTCPLRSSHARAQRDVDATEQLPYLAISFQIWQFVSRYGDGLFSISRHFLQRCDCRVSACVSRPFPGARLSAPSPRRRRQLLPGGAVRTRPGRRERRPAAAGTFVDNQFHRGKASASRQVFSIAHANQCLAVTRRQSLGAGCRGRQFLEYDAARRSVFACRKCGSSTHGFFDWHGFPPATVAAAFGCLRRQHSGDACRWQPLRLAAYLTTSRGRRTLPNRLSPCRQRRLCRAATTRRRAPRPTALWRTGH